MKYHERALKEIYRWRDELHRTRSGADVIRAMEQRIQSEADERKLKPLHFILAQEHEAQGNYAAAEAIYHQDPLDEVYRWYEQRMGAGIETVQAVEERIDSEVEPAKRRELKFILAQEHREHDDYAVAEEIYLQLIEAEPDDPTPLIELAEQKLYFERQSESAKRIIDRAIEVAYRSGNFRRNALSVKARIAVAMKDYQSVADTLKQIMRLGFECGNLDTGVMRDFFDRLPPGSIDPEVARQYDEHCRESDDSG